MIQTTIGVNGMMCGMCETHINEAIRRNFTVKKVTASRAKREAVIVSEAEIDPARLKAVIEETGYTPGEIRQEEYKKKGLFGLW